MMTPMGPPLPRARRPSSAGCLTGCFLKLIGALVLGCLVVLALYVIVAPWAFFLGSQFHPLGFWQGWGTMHGPAGDYAVFVRIYPQTRANRTAYNLSGPSVTGSAIVCTPRGEKYRLRVSGGFAHRLGFRQTDTNGQEFDLTLNQPLNFLNTNSYTRLSVSFHGTWQDRDLVLSDRGTLSRAFNTDGTWTEGDRSKRPLGPPVSLTLHAGNSSDFASACASVKR
jgi:hypothetical protein